MAHHGCTVSRRTTGTVLAWALVGVAVAPGCGGSRSTNFDEGGSSGTGASGSDTGGSSGAPSGGSSGMGGSSGDAQGGSATGGTSTGGTSTGGTSTGGSTSGGDSTGGVATGGSSTAGGGAGGNGAGGRATGGRAMGGALAGGMGGVSNAGKGGAGGAPVMCVANSDAMDRCGQSGTSCLCCPLGGPATACICTTQCMTDDDCKDAVRPHCNIDTRFTERGICTPEEFVCRWGTR